MGAFFGALGKALPYISAGASAGSGIAGGRSAKQLGRVAAREEKLIANQQAIERRERLINALAAQNAGAGARGIASQGSPTQVMGRQIELYDAQEEAENAITKTRVQLLRRGGSVAARTANIGAGISLLETVARERARR